MGRRTVRWAAINLLAGLVASGCGGASGHPWDTCVVLYGSSMTVTGGGSTTTISGQHCFYSLDSKSHTIGALTVSAGSNRYGSLQVILSKSAPPGGAYTTTTTPELEALAAAGGSVTDQQLEAGVASLPAGAAFAYFQPSPTSTLYYFTQPDGSILITTPSGWPESAEGEGDVSLQFQSVPMQSAGGTGGTPTPVQFSGTLSVHVGRTNVFNTCPVMEAGAACVNFTPCSATNPCFCGVCGTDGMCCLAPGKACSTDSQCCDGPCTNGMCGPGYATNPCAGKSDGGTGSLACITYTEAIYNTTACDCFATQADAMAYETNHSGDVLNPQSVTQCPSSIGCCCPDATGPGCSCESGPWVGANGQQVDCAGYCQDDFGHAPIATCPP